MSKSLSHEIFCPTEILSDEILSDKVHGKCFKGTLVGVKILASQGSYFPSYSSNPIVTSKGRDILFIPASTILDKIIGTNTSFPHFDDTVLKNRCLEIFNDVPQWPFLKMLCCQRDPFHTRKGVISDLSGGRWRARGLQEIEALHIDIERCPIDHHPIFTT